MKRTIYTGVEGNFEKAVVTMPNKYGYGGAHQPNIIGNIEDMSIQDSVDELELASLDNNNDMFSKSKSKSLTRKQAKAA